MNEIETAIADAGYAAFARALAESAYGAELARGGPYTIFAPTDAAFGKFPQTAMERLRKDAALLRTVMGYHLAPGKAMSRIFVGKRFRAMTCAGETLAIRDRDGVYVNKAKLVQPDVIIGACVLHGVDGVLWPHEPAAVAQ